ncbi:MAG: hypothetical protein EOP06_09045, partial [Proteobacteria bacterium]
MIKVILPLLLAIPTSALCAMTCGEVMTGSAQNRWLEPSRDLSGFMEMMKSAQASGLNLVYSIQQGAPPVSVDATYRGATFESRQADTGRILNASLEQVPGMANTSVIVADVISPDLRKTKVVILPVPHAEDRRYAREILEREAGFERALFLD